MSTRDIGLRCASLLRFTSALCLTIVLLATLCGAQTNSSPWTSTSASPAPAAVQPGTSSTVPRLVSFNGVVTAADGKQQAGSVSVTFSLYESQQGGAPVSSETQAVTADDQGNYSVLLGSTLADGLPADLFSTGQPRWLGVLPKLDGVTEYARVLLVSIPYALKAADADTLGGKPASAYLLSSPASDSGSTAGSGSATNSTGGTSSNGISPQGIQGNLTGAGKINYIPLWTSSTNLGNSNLFQAPSRFVGVNTTSPQAQFESVTTSKWAIIGEDSGTSSGSTGVLGIGQSTTAANIGVQGVTHSASGVAADFQNTSASGGDIIHAEGADGVRVMTVNSGLGSSGTPLLNLVPPFVNSASDAVVGLGGGPGYSTSGNGGVFYGGVNGNFIPPGFGVVANGGNNDDSLTVSGDGLLAMPGSDCCGGGTGKAAILAGDVDVEGTLTKSGGSFKIDHPLDPANKYLYHSFVESPDMMNIYSGVAVLDSTGKAMVQLPEWFEALNRDYRYQLTPIGAPAPNLHIAQEVANHQFSIGGGSAGLKVSWQITGIRQDAWANAHRIPVEVNKRAAERGHYIHPELFGAPAEASVLWARHPAQMQRIRRLQERNAKQAQATKPN